MHWLTDRVSELQELHDTWKNLRGADEEEDAPTEPSSAAKARLSFLRGLTELVEEVAERKGIDAAFASHDGLLVHCAGGPATADALAAVAASVVLPAYNAADTLEMGPLQQVVFAGTDRKLALLVIGDLSIGVLASVDVHLASVLSK